MQKPEPNDDAMQAMSMGSTGIMEHEECILVGYPPELIYDGRGRSHIEESPVTLTFAKLRELIDDAEKVGKPLLFTGQVAVQPPVRVQDTFTPIDAAEEEEALRNAGG